MSHSGKLSAVTLAMLSVPYLLLQLRRNLLGVSFACVKKGAHKLKPNDGAQWVSQSVFCPIIKNSAFRNYWFDPVCEMVEIVICGCTQRHYQQREILNRVEMISLVVGVGFLSVHFFDYPLMYATKSNDENWIMMSISCIFQPFLVMEYKSRFSLVFSTQQQKSKISIAD